MGQQIVVLKASSESEIDTAFATLVATARRRALRRRRSVLQQPARSARGAGGAPCGSGDICDGANSPRPAA